MLKVLSFVQCKDMNFFSGIDVYAESHIKLLLNVLGALLVSESNMINEVEEGYTGHKANAGFGKYKLERGNSNHI